MEGQVKKYWTTDEVLEKIARVRSEERKKARLLLLRALTYVQDVPVLGSDINKYLSENKH